MKKIQLGVICGGQSAEHEISLISARNIVAALDVHRYDMHILFVNKQGAWFLFEKDVFLKATDVQLLQQATQTRAVNWMFGDNKKMLFLQNKPAKHLYFDVVFPVLHGSHGEDGLMQGLLELVNVPYVGSDVLGSAICMDKDITKRLARAAKIPTNKFMTVTFAEAAELNLKAIVKKLGLPLFVKPANTGSSVGISKVKKITELKAAIALALQFDCKILIEQYVAGREIECAVLGNENPKAALAAEIIPQHEFYSYEAKYLDPNGALLKVPANLPPRIMKKVQRLAEKTFSVLGCIGMARIDFFVTKKYAIYLNEANTIPGFTQISMYPKMWMASGMTYSALLDELIQLALQHFQRRRMLMQYRDNHVTRQSS